MTFLELAKGRYSVRSFENRPIEEEKLQMILEAGRVAPSAHNCQPQRIYVAKSESARKKLASVCPCTFDAPVILMVCYDLDRERKSKWNPGYGFGETDAAIVCTHMMLEAADLGIGSCWVGMFNKQQVKEVMELPESEVVLALLPLGYPADNAKPLPLHSQYRAFEETIQEI